MTILNRLCLSVASLTISSYNRSFMSVSRHSRRFFCFRFFIMEKMKSGFGVENPSIILKNIPTKYHLESIKTGSD